MASDAAYDNEGLRCPLARGISVIVNNPARKRPRPFDEDALPPAELNRTHGSAASNTGDAAPYAQ